MRKTLAILAALACGSAWAAPRESVTFNNVDSVIADNSSLVTAAFTGTYAPKYITVSGVLTVLQSGTYAREAVIQVFMPGEHSFVIQPFDLNQFSTLVLDPMTFRIPIPIASAAGVWSFRCLEAYDDGERNAADARWTRLTIEVHDGPPVARDYGGITSAGLIINAGALNPGEVRWYRLSLDAAATIGGQTYFDLDTWGSTGDTEIALFREDGTLVAYDDDDGPILSSQLTFGKGGRASVCCDGLPYDGRDGELAAGTYYVALTSYDAVFSGGWGVVPGQQFILATYLRLRSNTGVGDCPADLDDGSGMGAKDGGVTIDDLLYFLQRFEAGC